MSEELERSTGSDPLPQPEALNTQARIFQPESATGEVGPGFYPGMPGAMMLPSSNGSLLTEAVASGVMPEVPVEHRMMALHEIFQRKQTDLLLSYQQAQANLALQHLKYSQQLSSAPVEPPGPPEEPSFGTDRYKPPHGTLLSSASLNHIPSSGEREGLGPRPGDGDTGSRPLRRTFSHGSSGTISEHTRQKLIDVLEKKNKQKGRVDGSPHFEPYPLVKAGAPSVTNTTRPALPHPIGGDYELRKVSSEPNLKMKQRLREKLLRQRPGPQSPLGISAFHSPPPQIRPPLGSAIPSFLNELGPGPSGPQAFIFPSPSLPNIQKFPHLDLNQPTLFPPVTGSGLAAQTFNPNLFLSMPSLFPFVHPTGAPTPAMGITLPLANSLEHFEAASKYTAPEFSGKILKGSGIGDGGVYQQVPTISAGSHPNLLKQQLRDLVLRRKSLVREETEDEITREVSVIQGPPPNLNLIGPSLTRKTGLAYDSAMSKHQCMCKQNKQHVEHGGRIHSVWARLQERGLTERCERIAAKKAALDNLKLVHSDTYVTFFAISPAACLKMVEQCRDPSSLPLTNFVQLPCGGYGVDSDTYFNDATTQIAARLAAGHVIELGLQVLDGRILNGFAVVRPPGHHAERDQAMGFCYFNNVAVAVKVVQHRIGMSGRGPLRIAIIDWDVHHGNGTQLAFEDDPNVLYISMHRHDNGNFFPGTGAVTDIGKDGGKYFSINIPWSGGAMGDAEYLAAWRVVVQPVLEQYQPEMIFVSAGFDAAKGHPAALGGYELSAHIFGYMTKQLMGFAGGRLVLALEGGYDLAAISDASELCVETLLSAGQPHSQTHPSQLMEEAALNAVPAMEAQETLQKVVAVHKNHWRRLSAEGCNLSQAQWDAMSSRFRALSVKHPE